MNQSSDVVAIDLFCGAGGLSYGLQQAGISVAAGIDIDPACSFPFETNIGAPCLLEDVRKISAERLTALWGSATIRLLAGCAPCQPFSPHRRGQDTSSERDWTLLDEFARLTKETLPELVTMENVPRVGSSAIFAGFVETLGALGYSVEWSSRRGVDYGLAQGRRRLVLLASRLGPIHVPAGAREGKPARTVRQVIGRLPKLESGGVDTVDPLHRARALSSLNLKRIRASSPGGTWLDWPEDLRAPCHRRPSGASFRNMYARMDWDQPAPTITTLAHNFGAGRFGHPEQDRPISLREAAMLQGFPRRYKFVPRGGKVSFDRLGRLIGNAVPPPIAKAVGAEVTRHVAEYAAADRDAVGVN